MNPVDVRCGRCNRYHANVSTCPVRFVNTPDLPVRRAEYTDPDQPSLREQIASLEAERDRLRDALAEARHCIVHLRDERTGDRTVNGYQWLLTHTVQGVIDTIDRAALDAKEEGK